MSGLVLNGVHAGPAMLAAFLASLVEFVEALTIVLAVALVRGWRPALMGAAAGTALLTLLVLAFGPSLAAVPIALLQLVIGVLLLLFGARWLRKAILRSAGVIPLHDEAQVFQRETSALAGAGTRGGWDALAVATSFKAVMLEGLEVIFIVIAVGAAGGALVPAGLGAAAALVLVAALGAIVHRPLARVPENALKFLVGVMISAFGVFWVGEGAGFHWPGEDWAIPVLIAAFLLLALALVRGLRMMPADRAG